MGIAVCLISQSSTRVLLEVGEVKCEGRPNGWNWERVQWWCRPRVTLRKSSSGQKRSKVKRLLGEPVAAICVDEDSSSHLTAVQARVSNATASTAGGRWPGYGTKVVGSHVLCGYDHWVGFVGRNERMNQHSKRRNRQEGTTLKAASRRVCSMTWADVKGQSLFHGVMGEEDLGRRRSSIISIGLNNNACPICERLF